MKSRLFVFGLFVVFCFSLFPADAQQEPVPYGPDEFPSWAKSFRRGEIIAFGLLPFAFLFTSLSYQGLRYVSGTNSSGIFSGPTTDRDKLGVIGVSVSLSVLLAVIDYFMDRHQATR